MKNNLTNFDDLDKFLRLSDVNQIVNGFIEAKGIIQEKLITIVKTDPKNG